jgi:hypothetical protein
MPRKSQGISLRVTGTVVEATDIGIEEITLADVQNVRCFTTAKDEAKKKNLNIQRVSSGFRHQLVPCFQTWLGRVDGDVKGCSASG